MQESHYLSADKATQIHSVKWTPSSESIAIVQIAHGVTEYIERYAPLAKYLTDRGIIVVGNDHLGHGDSIRRDNTPLTIGSKDTEQYLVDDFYTCYKNTKQEHPNLPYILLGFSLGSFVVRVALGKYPDMANGAIIMGTGQQPALMLSLAQAMAKSEAKKAGGFDHWTKKSTTWPSATIIKNLRQQPANSIGSAPTRPQSTPTTPIPKNKTTLPLAYLTPCLS